MSLPTLEPFTGTAAPLAGSFTQAYAGGTVNKNGSGLGTGSTINFEAFAYWNLDAFNNDQYSQITFKSGASNAQYVEVVARASGTEGTTTLYQAYSDGASGAGHTELAKYVNNVQTILRNFATSFTADDVMLLTVVGTTITLYKNGVSVGTQTDNTIASGAAGPGSYDKPTFDDWQGGNVSVAAAQIGILPGTRRVAARSGPFDRKGFLKQRVWPTDINTSSVTAAGDAIGIANATADAELIEAGDAIGVANAGAAAQLVESSAATGIASSSAAAVLSESAAATGIANAAGTTEEDVENASAIGIANASESGAVLVVAAAASGVASASAAAQLAASAGATGIAVATASLEEDVENGSATGEADAAGAAVVVGAAAAVGIATATAGAGSPYGGSATGEAAATAAATLVESGAATGESRATADSPQATPDLVFAYSSRLPPWRHTAPQLGEGHAHGTSNASARAVLLASGDASGSSAATADGEAREMPVSAAGSASGESIATGAATTIPRRRQTTRQVRAAINRLIAESNRLPAQPDRIRDDELLAAFAELL